VLADELDPFPLTIEARSSALFHFGLAGARTLCAASKEMCSFHSDDKRNKMEQTELRTKSNICEHFWNETERLRTEANNFQQIRTFLERMEQNGTHKTDRTNEAEQIVQNRTDVLVIRMLAFVWATRLIG
jgi:hypothetical protein